MKFAVRRTSGWEGSPCDEAYQDTYTYVDRRSADDPRKIPAYQHLSNQDWWYGEGNNHRIVDGQIARDFEGRKGWFIDINSLDELLAFQEKYGRLVIESMFGSMDTVEIEIYDSYRE